MSRDIETLYERATRDMRPDFKRELRAHLVAASAPTDVSPAPFEHPREGDLIVLDTHRPHRRWYGPLLVGVAAGIAVVAGLVMTPRRSADDGPSAPPTSCAPDAEALGVVRTETVDIRVLLMANGYTFCLVDDDDASSLGPSSDDDLLIDATIGEPSTSEPSVVDQGVVATAARWYVIAIPEGMPVAGVRAADRALQSFPTRVARRLLVIDADGSAREFNLNNAAGVVLATIVFDT